MAGRTPARAVAAYLEPLIRALSCVSRTNQLLIDGHSPEMLHAVTSPAYSIQIRQDLNLSVAQQVEIVRADGERGPWKVSTRGYDYQLADRAGELLAYHWHPLSTPNRREPHLHMDAQRLGGRKTHLPTGRIALEDILLFALEELDARPLRDDWREVLEASRENFRQWRTWS